MAHDLYAQARASIDPATKRRSPIFFESMAEAAKAGKKALAQMLAKQAA